MPSAATKEALCSASPTIARLLPGLEAEIDADIAERRAKGQAALGWRRRAPIQTHLARSAEPQQPAGLDFAEMRKREPRRWHDDD